MKVAPYGIRPFRQILHVEPSGDPHEQLMRRKNPGDSEQPLQIANPEFRYLLQVRLCALQFRGVAELSDGPAAFVGQAGAI